MRYYSKINRQFTNFLSSLALDNKKAVIDSANPRLYGKETVYKFSFLIGSGHFLHCLPLSDFRLPRHKQCSSMSIPKSNSKIVSLSLLIYSLLNTKAKPTSRRRRKFLFWQGGFGFCERRVLDVRKANKIQNNTTRMKINKPYLYSTGTVSE